MFADLTPRKPDVRALLRMGRTMVDLYCESFRQIPKRIVLDIDDTFDAVHGGQQLRLFNAYHDEYGFQPIVAFDGEGRFVTAVLRPAKRPGGKEIKAFLRRLVRHSAPTGRGPKSCCAPTVIIAVPRCSTFVPHRLRHGAHARRTCASAAIICSASKRFFASGGNASVIGFPHFAKLPR
jgi:hypothetical protein